MTEQRHYHFIGIGGIGMSALARILLDKKEKVSGSDLALSATVKELQTRGADIRIGQSKEAIVSQATIVYSTDIQKDNPEYERAHELNCRMLHRSELLKELLEGYKSLGVAGTHGKTTSTSLLMHILHCAGKEPAFAIGGTIPGKVNGAHGKGPYFVLEADESDGTFLNYHPFGAIITNIEPEHMNHYQTQERLEAAFKQFASQVISPDHLFYCGDDATLCKLISRGFSYGFKEGCDLKISSYRQEGWKTLFDIEFKGKKYLSIESGLVGLHNALNASACFGLALQLGIDESFIREGLKSFGGVKRRLEKRGEHRGVLLLDDYGHHPTEIKATLQGLRQSVQERRVVVVFQPHRYTRVSDHFDAFASAFDMADFVFVLPIYGAREKPIEGITSGHLVKRMQELTTVPCATLETEKALSTLTEFLRPHDVLVTFGAGDVTAMHDPLNASFEKTPPRKYRLGLIFGGRSCEHEISLRSARFVDSSLDPALYDIHYFGIDKAGNWIIGNKAKEALQGTAIDASFKGEPLLSPSIVEALNQCELFFPVLHGPFGEDGTIQGFFEMLSKPYAGPDFRSAAITMDKILTKKLLLAAGVPTPPYVAFDSWQWRTSQEALLKEMAEKEWSYPLYVKPAKVGSSVGVTRVESHESLREAIESAFRFDNVVLVEEGKIAREIEFPCTGNGWGRVAVPPPGEKLAEGAFVDYQKKYSSAPVKMTPQALLDEPTLKKGQELAKKAYEAVGVSGMSRVDCLLDRDNNYWFFEVNGIPGLTPLSLFPKVWSLQGLDGKKLMDRLIVLGLSRYFDQSRHNRTL